MKRFRFQLETLERVRKSREDEALRALSQAQRVFNLSVERKENLKKEIEIALLRRENLGQNFTDILAFQLETDFIDGNKVRITQQEQVIFKSKKGVENALRFYLQARRQTRMIEMLRERAFAEYKVQRSRYEQRQQDDLSIMRARLREIA